MKDHSRCSLWVNRISGDKKLRLSERNVPDGLQKSNSHGGWKPNQSRSPAEQSEFSRCERWRRRKRESEAETNCLSAVCVFITESLEKTFCAQTWPKITCQQNVTTNSDIHHRPSAFYRELCTSRFQGKQSVWQLAPSNNKKQNLRRP